MDNKTKEFIKENAVNEGFLQDWYQNSVLETDTPIWTDEHIAEMVGDFYLIPREVIDGRENYYGCHENPDDYNTDDADMQNSAFNAYEPSEKYIRERRTIKILMLIMILSVIGGIIIKHCKHNVKYDTIAVPSVDNELTSEETDTIIPAETTNTDIKNNEELRYDKEKYPKIITDIIRYNNLTPEKTYKLSYHVFNYDKETQEVISERIAVAEFIPTESAGTIRIAIPCTLSEYESIIDDSQDIPIKLEWR